MVLLVRTRGPGFIRMPSGAVPFKHRL